MSLISYCAEKLYELVCAAGAFCPPLIYPSQLCVQVSACVRTRTRVSMCATEKQSNGRCKFNGDMIEKKCAGVCAAFLFSAKRVTNGRKLYISVY